MAEGYNFGHLRDAILPLSQADDWVIAKKEWERSASRSPSRTSLKRASAGIIRSWNFARDQKSSDAPHSNRWKSVRQAVRGSGERGAAQRVSGDAVLVNWKVERGHGHQNPHAGNDRCTDRKLSPFGPLRKSSNFRLGSLALVMTRGQLVCVAGMTRRACLVRQ